MKYATCHPQEKHVAKGLCKECYSRHKYLKQKENIEFIEKRRNNTKKYYEQNPRKSRLSAKKHRLKSKFNITLEEYNRLLNTQGGVCALCENKDIDRDLAVDHCHNTGRIRGLLCMRCNVELGIYEKVLANKNKVDEYLRGING